MPTTKWILPEGIDDILPEQAYWLEMKRREVIDTFISSGYGLVIPPLIEYTERLQNMISFIKENDIVIDDNDIEEVETEIIYREKPKESKLNPIVIGAIAIGGALILSKTNN